MRLSKALASRFGCFAGTAWSRQLWVYFFLCFSARRSYHSTKKPNTKSPHAKSETWNLSLGLPTVVFSGELLSCSRLADVSSDQTSVLERIENPRCHFVFETRSAADLLRKATFWCLLYRTDIPFLDGHTAYGNEMCQQHVPSCN